MSSSVGDGSPVGFSDAELPGAGAEAVPVLEGLLDAGAEADAPGTAGPDAEAAPEGVTEGAAGSEADADALGVAPGLADAEASLGAGCTSTSSDCFWSWPEIGSQGAVEFPPSTAITSVTAYTAQIVASTQPTRRYVLLRRPLSSTNTGPSDGSGGPGSTGSSES